MISKFIFSFITIFMVNDFNCFDTSTHGSTQARDRSIPKHAHKYKCYSFNSFMFNYTLHLPLKYSDEMNPDFSV